METRTWMFLGALLGITLTVLGILYAQGKITIKKGTLPTPSGKFLVIILDIIGYCTFLALVRLVFPNFWENWNTTNGNPNDSTFFWLTNFALFLCIVAMTVKFHRSWGFVGTLFVIGLILYYCHSNEKKGDNNKTDNTTETTVTRPIPGSLLPMYSGYTPCDVFIGWKFKIKTDGSPITVKFKGVANKIAYPGTGRFDAPSNFQSGFQHIESGDPANPVVYVEVYQVAK